MTNKSAFRAFFVPANFLQLLAHFIKDKNSQKQKKDIEKNMVMDMHMAHRQATLGSCSSWLRDFIGGLGYMYMYLECDPHGNICLTMPRIWPMCVWDLHNP